MKPTTKILSSLVLCATLTTSATAYMGNGNCPNSGDCPAGMINKGYGSQMGNKGMKGQRGMRNPVMPLVWQLSLTPEQTQKIRTIMMENRKNRPSPYLAFSKNGFDKDKYIKQKEDRRATSAKRQADTIEKVYNILDSKQKEQLRVLMDLRESKKEQIGQRRGMK